MKNILYLVIFSMFTSCMSSTLCGASNEFAEEDHLLWVANFLLRIVPTRERDRTMDMECLNIKRDIQERLKDESAFESDTAKKGYIREEGLAKIFPAFIEEPSTLKALQLRDLLNLGHFDYDAGLFDDIWNVIFNMENNAHPFADFNPNHPFRHHQTQINFWKNAFEHSDISIGT